MRADSGDPAASKGERENAPRIVPPSATVVSRSAAISSAGMWRINVLSSLRETLPEGGSSRPNMARATSEIGPGQGVGAHTLPWCPPPAFGDQPGVRVRVPRFARSSMFRGGNENRIFRKDSLRLCYRSQLRSADLAASIYNLQYTVSLKRDPGMRLARRP